MKTKLTVEESAKLIELGVDPKLASMVSWKQTEDWARKSVLPNKEHLTLKPFRPMVMGFERFEVKDVFTRADILNILPKEIEIEGEKEVLNIVMDNYGALVGYPKFHEKHGCAFVNPELINSLNMLLVWCLENKIIKLKEN